MGSFPGSLFGTFHNQEQAETILHARQRNSEGCMGHRKNAVCEFAFCGSFSDLGFGTGFGASCVWWIPSMCGGSHLRSLLRSPAAGGSKTTPEQVCNNWMGSPHTKVPGVDFHGMPMKNPSRTFMVPWTAVPRLGAKTFKKPTKSEGPEPYGSPFGNPLLLLLVLQL